MAATFTVAFDEEYIVGNKRHRIFTYVAAGGSTGGAIPHGLDVCERAKITAEGAAIVADAPTVDTTTTPLPDVSGSINIIVTADTIGRVDCEGC